ncbi:MAG TPA: thiamine phosphate synthase [Pseudomonadales bacterium]|jgi:thiamine-phosphate pyrophosphorylase|nr:thiamine phosphate synthase [Pseudomonadales bacterium]
MTPPLRGLYAITDDHLLVDRLLPAVQAALAGGCRWVQYRSKHSKHSNAQQRKAEAQQLLTLCRTYNAFLLINDDVALAKTVGADGVHLGQEDMSLTEARRVLGKQAIIGITCHNSLSLAHTAQQEGADYVAFGRFFSSSTKQSAPPADLSILHTAKQQLAIPVVAIGGITLDNAKSVLDEGADMLAVVGDLFSAHDVTARAQAYTALFD